jgi:hypothetical protein
MNPWLRELVTEHLITAGGVNPARAGDVVDSLWRMLQDRHITMVPSYLSDEMFHAQIKIAPDADYLAHSRKYALAVWEYHKMASSSQTTVDG